jgi:hypothetical protein
VIDGNAVESGRCLWCGRQRIDLRVLQDCPEYHGFLVSLHEPLRVCGDHESQLDSFIREVARRSVWLLVAILLGSLVLIAGGITERGYLVLTGMAIIGVVFVVFPFATPETVSRFGVERSVRIVRSVGFVIVVLGVAAAVWTPFG